MYFSSKNFLPENKRFKQDNCFTVGLDKVDPHSKTWRKASLDYFFKELGSMFWNAPKTQAGLYDTAVI